MDIEKEITYLKGLVDEIQYQEDLFTIYLGEGKIVFGAFMMEPSQDKFFSYRTVYSTILDVDKKIKLSLNYAIDWAYKVNMDKFNPFSKMDENEHFAIYYTENAVFRTIVLWDLLAQIYNVKYGIKKNIKNIYYKSFFREPSIEPFANVITEYIEESDFVEGDPWQGNHTYVNEYRNKMTHRNSPNVTTISTYDIEMRMPMQYVLKRVVEDYHKVSSFIQQVLESIILEFQNAEEVING